MTPSAEVINSVPGIANKNYLELGISYYEGTFKDVGAHLKVSVDVDAKQQPKHLMPTDKFFENCARIYPPFDIIFIDADHAAMQVMRDYNNAIQYLRKDKGLIFIHDLIPRDAHEIKSCGDGFRFLYMLRREYPGVFFSEDSVSHGLTCFYNPAPQWFHLRALETITWETFAEQKATVLTHEEMCRRVSELVV